MNKKILLLLIFVCLPLLVAAKNIANVQLIGVEGKLLNNIQSRLNEIAKIKALASESNEELILHIAKSMYPYGFFKPEIKINRGNGDNLVIIINPGPRLMITHLSVNISGEGRDNAAIKQALANFTIKQGDPLNSVKYENAKQALLSATEREGYLHASFTKAEILIDKANYTVAITLVLNTGQQYFFGQVQFDPTYISPTLLHRYIPFEYGQPYSAAQIETFNSNLSASGYFKSAVVKPQLEGETSIIPIDVQLKKAARINYSIGVGYGTDTGLRGRAGLHVAPVNRWGHKFNAVALGSFKENAIQTQYIIPGKNPVVDQYEVNTSLSNLNYTAGHSNSALLSLLQRHNLTNFQRIISLNALDERFRYSYQPQLERLSLYPKVSLTWLNRGDQLFSPNGYKITVNGLVANKAILSELSFWQASLDAKAALTLTAIRTRLYFHTIQGITRINNIDQFPLSLALLLGGSDNLKGYSYASIGPGKVLTYGGVEIQKETKKNWYLVGFFDTGDIYNPALKNPRNDIGIGLMWVSPIGPIKVGVAQAIDANFQRTRGRTPKLVISMGPDL